MGTKLSSGLFIQHLIQWFPSSWWCLMNCKIWNRTTQKPYLTTRQKREIPAPFIIWSLSDYCYGSRWFFQLDDCLANDFGLKFWLNVAWVMYCRTLQRHGTVIAIYAPSVRRFFSRGLQISITWMCMRTGFRDFFSHHDPFSSVLLCQVRTSSCDSCSLHTMGRGPISPNHLPTGRIGTI